ncbi:flippase-like domain-containing protein [Desulfobotulus sp. H1]|uniref:Flippase-like domain-containing protein n=1 Tax=Desulfobotulus pelophilus TaxID=2823377 RepID=A0ABT3N8G1_9BACT|nr:lysylphosphatidylglycerol synthase transmembrane domain-containing protein [Desulfobotulus pelophilus]MCW7753746.1 flippase-like domain-containing protein [Desulfobotulus pelophilus]
MNKAQQTGMIIALPLSLGALYLAFRHVPMVELTAYFTSLNYVWLLPAILFCLLGYVLRALRWQLLLRHKRQLRFLPAFHPMMIGFMLNSILPGRVGEVVRPALLARKEKIPFPTAFSTIAAERVLDLAILLSLLALIFGFADMTSAEVHSFGDYRLSTDTLALIAKNMALLCLALIGIIICLQINTLRNHGKAILRKLVSHLPGLSAGNRKTMENRVLPSMEKLLDQIASGFDGLRKPSRLLLCLVFSLGVWLIQVLPFWFLAQAGTGIPATMVQLTAVMVLVNFFIAIPSVPGFWGIWEAGIVFSLALFGIRGADAAGYALLTHAVLMFPVIFVGLGSALLTGFRFSANHDPEACQKDLNDCDNLKKR